MISSITPAQAPAGDPTHSAAGDPPSLRRRAPGRIDLTLKSGQCLTANRRKMHLQAGRTIILQVVPQSPAAKVEIAVEPPLHTIVPATRVESGPVPVYYYELTALAILRVIPIPATGRIHITVIDGLPAPCRITIPITVWPSYRMLAVWWVLVFLTILGLRWQRTVVAGTSLADVLMAIWRDFPYLLSVLTVGLLILIPLWFLGWLLSLVERSESND